MPEAGRITITRSGRLKSKGYQTKLQDSVDEATRDTASAIETDIKGGGAHPAPYKTGNLRRSYHISFTRWKDHILEVGNDPRIANYAIFLELGTRFMAARPHLVPALEAQRKLFTERIRKHFGVGL